MIARFRVSIVEHSHLFKSELEIASLPEAGEHVPSSVYTETSALVVEKFMIITQFRDFT